MTEPVNPIDALAGQYEAQIQLQQAEQEQQRREQTAKVVEELKRCQPWIQAALDSGVDTTHTFEDIALGVLQARYQLWAADDACGITEVLHYPQTKHLHIFLAGGNMERLVDMNASVEEFARYVGASAVTINGRKGWAKVLAPEGYEPLLTTLAKKLGTIPKTSLEGS